MPASMPIRGYNRYAARHAAHCCDKLLPIHFRLQDCKPHGDCSRVQKLFSRRRLIQIQHYEKRKFLAFKFNLIAFKMTP
jgi:hypothetical protein